MNEEKNECKALDLFCGAGGLSLGFQQAGFKIIAGIDVNEGYLETFKHNHSNHAKAIEADLMNEGPEKLLRENEIDPGEMDVVIGGPPCKGFSIAGKRDPEDERNNLVDKFIDYVEYIKPKMFLMENVPGIKSMKNGEVLRIIMSRFKNAGYNAKHRTLNSADYGVPQRRNRVIFIGRRDGEEPSYPERSHRPRKQRTLGEDELEPYKTVEEAILNKDLSELPNHEKPSHSKEMQERISEVEAGSSLYEHYGDSWVRLKKDEPSTTIKENHNAPFIHPEENRVGTVRECAILQSFPDDYVFKGPKSKQLKQVGNAVPPLLAKKLAEAMRKDLKEFR